MLTLRPLPRRAVAAAGPRDAGHALLPLALLATLLYICSSCSAVCPRGTVTLAAAMPAHNQQHHLGSYWSQGNHNGQSTKVTPTWCLACWGGLPHANTSRKSGTTHSSIFERKPATSATLGCKVDCLCIVFAAPTAQHPDPHSPSRDSLV
jgi:hypothetical protein